MSSRWRLRWQLLRSRHPDLATKGLIGTNVAVWGMYSLSPEPKRRGMEWLEHFGKPSGGSGLLREPRRRLEEMLPTTASWERNFCASYFDVVQCRRYYTLPLCTFMHTDGYHLLFNMFALFFFGRQLEYVLGLRRLLAFYLVSGTLAAAAQVGACGTKERHTKVLGASGGAYALMAFLTFLTPRQTVYLYMVIPVPMWLLMAGVVGLDVFFMRPGQAQEGHLAGIACGAAYYFMQYHA